MHVVDRSAEKLLRAEEWLLARTWVGLDERPRIMAQLIRREIERHRRGNRALVPTRATEWLVDVSKQFTAVESPTVAALHAKVLLKWLNSENLILYAGLRYISIEWIEGLK